MDVFSTWQFLGSVADHAASLLFFGCRHTDSGGARTFLGEQNFLMDENPLSMTTRALKILMMYGSAKESCSYTVCRADEEAGGLEGSKGKQRPRTFEWVASFSPGGILSLMACMRRSSGW
jgi:hypothetical protein